MNIMVLTCSPNRDGLTAACGKAACQGIGETKGETLLIRLNDLKISNCQACDNGWGTCLKEHECQVQDDFQELHQSMKMMDAFIVITPVYWGEMSESAKAFFDRLRRCEATNRDVKNIFDGKPVIAVAAAGGSGGGVLTCLSSMERLFSHMRAEVFDLIGITRKNRSYKLEAIRAAAKEMVITRR